MPTPFSTWRKISSESLGAKLSILVRFGLYFLLGLWIRNTARQYFPKVNRSTQINNFIIPTCFGLCAGQCMRIPATYELLKPRWATLDTPIGFEIRHLLSELAPDHPLLEMYEHKHDWIE